MKVRVYPGTLTGEAGEKKYPAFASVPVQVDRSETKLFSGVYDYEIIVGTQITSRRSLLKAMPPAPAEGGKVFRHDIFRSPIQL